jgi:hypothetical protein
MMKRLLLITAVLLALTGAADAGDRLPAVYLGHWCSTYSEPEDDPNLYAAKKPGVECARDWLMLKPHKLVDADGERECRYRSIKKYDREADGNDEREADRDRCILPGRGGARIYHKILVEPFEGNASDGGGGPIMTTRLLPDRRHRR